MTLIESLLEHSNLNTFDFKQIYNTAVKEITAVIGQKEIWASSVKTYRCSKIIPLYM